MFSIRILFLSIFLSVAVTSTFFLFFRSDKANNHNLLPQKERKTPADFPINNECKALLTKRFELNNDEDIKKLEQCIQQKYKNLKYYNLYTSSNGHDSTSRLMATAKSYHVIGHDGILSADIGGKDVSVGGLKFKLKGSDLDFITLEAPYGADVFASLIWKYKINTFVSLTTEKDNSPEKLEVYRDTSSNRVDLHWLRNMTDRNFSYEYQIYDYKSKSVNGENDFEIDTAKIKRLSEKERDLTQLVYRHWEDDSAVNYKILHKIVLEISKVHKDGPITINCFAGLHRTKTVAIALYIYDLKRKGQEISAEDAIKEYERAVLSEIIRKNGEQAPSWADKETGQRKLITDYVSFLNNPINDQGISG